MLRFDVPAGGVNTVQFAEELSALGYTGVDVSVCGDELRVWVDGLTDPMPPGADRDACSTQDELDELIAAATDKASVENADEKAAVHSALAAHTPAALTPAPTIEEEAAALPDPTADIDGFRAGLVAILTART